MKVKYIGPLDSVELYIGGRAVAVKRDETIDVPVTVAGRPPAARLAEIMDVELPAVFTDHAARVALLAELAEVDAGEGLLAQTTNWAAEKPAAEKKETGK